jgi:hypothetical protein
MPEDKDKIQFLIARQAAEREHSASILISHLIGTRDVLSRWGARQAVCYAGLFHSVYGTQSYRSLVELDQRKNIQHLIGEEAEGLAYLFCAMTRRAFIYNLDSKDKRYIHDRFTGKWTFITQTDMQDICNIVVANWLEQVPRIPTLRNLNSAPLEKMFPFLLSSAQEELSRTLTE